MELIVCSFIEIKFIDKNCFNSGFLRLIYISELSSRIKSRLDRSTERVKKKEQREENKSSPELVSVQPIIQNEEDIQPVRPKDKSNSPSNNSKEKQSNGSNRSEDTLVVNGIDILSMNVDMPIITQAEIQVNHADIKLLPNEEILGEFDAFNFGDTENVKDPHSQGLK